VDGTHRHDLMEEVTLWKRQITHVLRAGDFDKYNYTVGQLYNLQSKLGMVPATNILPLSTYIGSHNDNSLNSRQHQRNYSSGKSIQILYRS
jgi:hypothetical protein